MQHKTANELYKSVWSYGNLIGVGRNRTEMYETARRCTKPHGDVRNRTEMHETARRCTKPHGDARNRTEMHETARSRVKQQGLHRTVLNCMSYTKLQSNPILHGTIEISRQEPNPTKVSWTVQNSLPSEQETKCMSGTRRCRAVTCSHTEVNCCLKLPCSLLSVAVYRHPTN